MRTRLWMTCSWPGRCWKLHARSTQLLSQQTHLPWQACLALACMMGWLRIAQLQEHWLAHAGTEAAAHHTYKRLFGLILSTGNKRVMLSRYGIAFHSMALPSAESASKGLA